MAEVKSGPRTGSKLMLRGLGEKHKSAMEAEKERPVKKKKNNMKKQIIKGIEFTELETK